MYEKSLFHALHLFSGEMADSMKKPFPGDSPYLLHFALDAAESPLVPGVMEASKGGITYQLLNSGESQ